MFQLTVIPAEAGIPCLVAPSFAAPVFAGIAGYQGRDLATASPRTSLGHLPATAQ